MQLMKLSLPFNESPRTYPRSSINVSVSPDYSYYNRKNEHSLQSLGKRGVFEDSRGPELSIPSAVIPKHVL